MQFQSSWKCFRLRVVIFIQFLFQSPGPYCMIRFIIFLSMPIYFYTATLQYLPNVGTDELLEDWLTFSWFGLLSKRLSVMELKVSEIESLQMSHEHWFEQISLRFWVLFVLNCCVSSLPLEEFKLAMVEFSKSALFVVEFDFDKELTSYSSEFSSTSSSFWCLCDIEKNLKVQSGIDRKNKKIRKTWKYLCNVL